MSSEFFQQEVDQALRVLQEGGVILYPTDTIWGLGCDATNEAAVRRIYGIKQREDSKSLIILVAEERDILQLVVAPDLAVFNYLEEQERPTTVIFDGATNLPDALIAADGSIAIRIVQDPFCRHLIKRLRKPIVSTSANISGRPAPVNFQAVSREIRESVEHVVRWRQDDPTPAQASRIMKWNADGSVTIIRD